MTVLAFEGVTKRFGTSVAVDGMTFDAPSGEVTGLLGPNGAGKTTALRLLLGLVRPGEGRATIDGVPFAQLADPGRRVGAMLAGAGAYPGRTGRQHLVVVAAALGRPARAADALLERVGLADAADRRVGGYSLGMRTRLALASALIGEPRALVLDEPGTGLDPEGVVWLRTLLAQEAREGRTVLVSSHALSEIEQTATRLVIVRDGRVVITGSTRELLARTTAGVRVRTDETERLPRLLAEHGISSVPHDGDALVVDAGARAVSALAAHHGIPLHELAEHGGGLEQLFMTIQEQEAPCST